MAKKSTSDIVLVAPAVETLLSRSEQSLWPQAILNHAEIVMQTDVRIRLSKNLDSLFGRIMDPRTDITSIIRAKIIREEELIELYDLLTAYLKIDPYHRRIVLYLPFELLPSKVERLASGALATAIDRFVDSYMKCWRGLLDETDVRANFVDGDILEPELAPNGQPLVRKAAHIIPILVRKGLISMREMNELVKGAFNEILRSSLADVLPALSDTEYTAKRDPYPNNEMQKESARGLLAELQEKLQFESNKIDMRHALDQSRGMPPARVAWERQNRIDILKSTYAEKVAADISADSSPETTVDEMLSAVSSAFTRHVVVRATGMLAERLCVDNLSGAVNVREILLRAYRSGRLADVPEILDELDGILSRLAALGIIDEVTVVAHGFKLPKLDAPFSTVSPLAEEVREFTPTMKIVARNSEYNELIYPAAIFFGSRFKGYAKREADLDAAVFVKPGVPEKDRKKVRQVTTRVMEKGRVGGKVVEFWLTKDGQGLRIRDFPDPDVYTADSTWVHLLFAGVWLGKKSAVGELHTRLLPNLLRSRGQTFKGRNIHDVRLSGMERETLQYRLMHKGYRRFFPRMGGIDGPGTERLDPTSVFWDSGYRRLATKLFVTRVFLPELV